MRFACLAALSAALFSTAAVAHADNLVNNGDFEDRLSGWSATFAQTGSYLVPDYGISSGGGHSSAEFGADRGAYDLLYQTLPTVAGGSYKISFDLLYSDTNGEDFQVLWDGGVAFDDAAMTSKAIGQWLSFNFTATAQGKDILGFRGYNEGGSTFLDSVTVATLSTPASTPTPSPTPEPSSLLLLGTGLLASMGVTRSRWS